MSGGQPKEIIHHFSFEIPPHRVGWSIHGSKNRGCWEGAGAGGVRCSYFWRWLNLAKIFHIHNWIFSAHGGQGQFLQSARHSKVKGMWLVDEGGKRDRHAWGFMVVRWEAASCWWVTVWAWCLRTCLLKGDAIRYPYLCEADIHMPLMQKRPLSIAELPLFWSLCQVVWASVLHVWMRNVDLLSYDHWEKTCLHKTLWLHKIVELHSAVCVSCLLNSFDKATKSHYLNSTAVS